MMIPIEARMTAHGIGVLPHLGKMVVRKSCHHLSVRTMMRGKKRQKSRNMRERELKIWACQSEGVRGQEKEGEEEKVREEGIEEKRRGVGERDGEEEGRRQEEGKGGWMSVCKGGREGRSDDSAASKADPARVRPRNRYRERARQTQTHQIQRQTDPGKARPE